MRRILSPKRVLSPALIKTPKRVIRAWPREAEG